MTIGENTFEISSGSVFPVVTRILEGNVQLSKNVTLGSF